VLVAYLAAGEAAHGDDHFDEVVWVVVRGFCRRVMVESLVGRSSRSRRQFDLKTEPYISRWKPGPITSQAIRTDKAQENCTCARQLSNKK
jgi:hypothetical protein